MYKYTKLFIAALACLMLAGLCGCGGGTVKPDYFTLSPLAHITSRTPVADLNAAVIGLGPITLPEYLTSRANIVASENANKLVFLDNARWAEPLDTNVELVLTDNLKYLLNSPHIIHYPWRASTKYDFHVTLTVSVLTANAETATLRARYQITGRAGNLLAERELNLTEPLAAFTAQDVVAAQNELINKISLDIAQTLAQTAGLNR